MMLNVIKRMKKINNFCPVSVKLRWELERVQTNNIYKGCEIRSSMQYLRNWKYFSVWKV